MTTRAHAESARRVSDCVTALLRDQPFFGSLALRLPIRPDAGRETLASNGQEIRYSPAWIADTDADLIKTAIARVVLACALKHHTRRGEREPERWQHASQLVTHGLLQDAGFKLPPEAQAWDGISVEQAYDRLPDPNEQGDGRDDTQPSGSGAAAGTSADSQPDAGDDDTSGAQSGAGDDDQTNDRDPSGSDDTQDDNGSAEDGPSGTPSVDPAGTGEVMDAPASNGDDQSAQAPDDFTEEEQAWDEAMHQALNLARAQGKAPGAVAETIRDAHRSSLDWRTLLRRYMTAAAARDYSWSLPNRRFIDSGLYLPSIRSEGIDTIAVIIDTSASLPARTLAEFWTEVREIATELQPETVIVLQVDSALQDAAEYAACDLPEEIALKGRGGTDFRPGFAWIEEQGLRPGVCVYLTDMECNRYPEAEPPYNVVWADYGGGVDSCRQPPPWGDRIDIAD